MELAWNKSHPDEALMILTKREFKEKYPKIFSASILGRVSSDLKYCQALTYQSVISGIFVIPKKEHPIREHLQFAFALSNERMIIVCPKSSEIIGLLDQFCEQYDLRYEHPLLFLLEFMLFLTSEDVYFLEEYSDKLERIEQQLFQGKRTDMAAFTLACRQDMNVLSNYYLQLTAVGETMQEAALDSGLDLPSSLISLYSARISQLSNMVADIKAHTSQIWDLKQTQLSDTQNRISTTLTIITVVFLPLTMITGWFGMNFPNMPLIHSDFGYPLTIVAVVIIVICELLYFRFSPSIRGVFSKRSMDDFDLRKRHKDEELYRFDDSNRSKFHKENHQLNTEPQLPDNLESAKAAKASLDSSAPVENISSGQTESDLMLEDSVRREMQIEHPDLPHCQLCSDGSCKSDNKGIKDKTDDEIHLL